MEQRERHRDPRPGSPLRRHLGTAGVLAHHPGRSPDRPGRTERRRQDHPAQPRDRTEHAVGRRPHRARRPPARIAAGTGRHRVRRPGRARLPRVLGGRHGHPDEEPQPLLRRGLRPAAPRRPRHRPAEAGRPALRRPAGAAGPDPRPGPAPPAARPGRADRGAGPAGPSRLHGDGDGGDGGRRRVRGAVLAPPRRAGTRRRPPGPDVRRTGLPRRGGRRPARRAPSRDHAVRAGHERPRVGGRRVQHRRRPDPAARPAPLTRVRAARRL